MASTKTLLEVTAIVAVIAVIWGLMSLPIIFYYSHLPQQSEGSDNNTEFNPMTSCIQGEYVYTGEVCKDTLFALKQCILSQSPDDSENVSINISAAIDLQISEQVAMIGEQYLQTLTPCRKCVAVLVPFMCQYLFTPCDERGVAYYPSSKDCVYIRDQACVREWEEITKLPTAVNYLPNCKSLPDDSLCSLDLITHITSTNGPTNGTNVSSPLMCSEGFVYVEEVNECRPHCPSWEEHEHGLSIAYNTIAATSAAMSLLASIAVLFLSCVRHKRMFTFPSVLIVYQVIPILILEITILIGFTDRETLFCNSQQDWLEVLCDKETPFCAFNAVVLYYTLWQTTLWWLFHIITMFCDIKFPLRTRSLKVLGHMKYVHIGLVIAGILIPVLPVAAIASGDRFRSIAYPPIFCVSSNPTSVFYGISFPLCILTATGVSLIVGTLWMIIKGYNRFNKSEKTKRVITKVIVKLLIIFCYFTIVSVLVLTVFTANQRNTSYRLALRKYLTSCKGDPSTKECDRKSFQQHSLVQLNLTSFILLSMYPFFCLLYAANTTELRECLSVTFNKLRNKFKTVECHSTAEQVNSQLKPSTLKLGTTPDSAATIQSFVSANSQ